LMVALRNKTSQRQITFAMGFLLFSFLGTTPGLYFRQHYFVLMLPALALIVGLAVEFLQTGPARWQKVVPVFLLLGVIGWDVYLQRWALFQLSPVRLSQVIYGDNPMAESQLVARYIREHSPETARVAVIGSEPEIYFYSHRHSATGYIYTYALMENQPFAATMQQQMIREIESGKPEFLVLVVNRYSWLFKGSSDLEIFGWVKKYTADYYERVGLVDVRAGKPGLQVWDEAVKTLQGNPEQYLAVYKRKP
jgi:4-amino-4-deoxy-L-arabinose transferase-like glycosyltransferase